MVDTGIGANKAVVRLRDEHVIASNDPPRLLQHDFHVAWIFLQLLAKEKRLRRRLYAREVNQRPLRLRNNFLCDDQHVAVFKVDGDSARSVGDSFRKFIATPNLGNPGKRKQAQFRRYSGRSACGRRR
jgi:hypothetical protein